MNEAVPRYGNYRRILFATDFSANADFAFGFAVDTALHNPGSVLFLLHVVPEPDAQFWKGYIYEADQDPDAKAKGDIDRRVDEVYRSRVPDGVDFRPVFRIGSAGQAILDFARAEQADLIVIGRQGHRAVTALFFGNVATHVARHAECPVLIIPLTFLQRATYSPTV